MIAAISLKKLVHAKPQKRKEKLLKLSVFTALREAVPE